jgi:hypothetical protein
VGVSNYILFYYGNMVTNKSTRPVNKPMTPDVSLFRLGASLRIFVYNRMRCYQYVPHIPGKCQRNTKTLSYSRFIFSLRHFCLTRNQLQLLYPSASPEYFPSSENH